VPQRATAPSSPGTVPAVADRVLPVLYLMAPMTLYWTAELAAAREYPFSDLTGCPVEVRCAEGMFPDTRSWQEAWPYWREHAAFGVFLDHLGGWVPRGVAAEVTDLTAMGKPVWWWHGGQPARDFRFGPGRPGDWRYCYRSVHLPGEQEAP